jgi:anaerobic glycerol-3-phosphate dehydrogenase
LVDVAGESRVRITIVEDVVAGKIIARIILLAATMRKDPKSIWRSKIRRTIPRELFNLPTLPLMPGQRSRHQRKNQRLIIIDDAISIDMETNRK